MIRTVPLISSFFSILFIFELNTDQATAQNYVANIGKLLSLIKNYDRAYDYYRKNYFWIRFADPKEVAEYTAIEYEHGYIQAQAKYGTNFSDLYSIFVAQTLAMIYAVKLKEKLFASPLGYMEPEDRSRINVYTFFAHFGALSDPVTTVILRMLQKKHPESYEKFKQISEVFHHFQTKVDREIFGIAMRNTEERDSFKTKLHEDAENLIKFIRTTFLQTTDQHSTGLGIDGGTDISRLSFDTVRLKKVLNLSPNRLFVNYDDDPKINMFRSTAMQLMKGLITNISQAISTETGVEVSDLVIDSFVHVRQDEATRALVFVEIPYTYVKNAFPEPEKKSDPDEP